MCFLFSLIAVKVGHPGGPFGAISKPSVDISFDPRPNSSLEIIPYPSSRKKQLSREETKFDSIVDEEKGWPNSSRQIIKTSIVERRRWRKTSGVEPPPPGMRPHTYILLCKKVSTGVQNTLCTYKVDWFHFLLFSSWWQCLYSCFLCGCLFAESHENKTHATDRGHPSETFRCLGEGRLLTRCSSCVLTKGAGDVQSV